MAFSSIVLLLNIIQSDILPQFITPVCLESLNHRKGNDILVVLEVFFSMKPEIDPKASSINI